MPATEARIHQRTEHAAREENLFGTMQRTWFEKPASDNALHTLYTGIQGENVHEGGRERLHTLAHALAPNAEHGRLVYAFAERPTTYSQTVLGARGEAVGDMSTVLGALYRFPHHTWYQPFQTDKRDAETNVNAPLWNVRRAATILMNHASHANAPALAEAMENHGKLVLSAFHRLEEVENGQLRRPLQRKAIDILSALEDNPHTRTGASGRVQGVSESAAAKFLRKLATYQPEKHTKEQVDKELDDILEAARDREAREPPKALREFLAAKR